jgi:glycosyltransferase involved in cell wall biosynthesis
MTRPRLLFIANAFPPALLPGSPRTWSIATRLAGLGWDVEVATVPADQWNRRMKMDDAPITRTEIPDSPLLVADLKRPKWMPPLAAKIARRLLYTLRIDPYVVWSRRVVAAMTKRKPGTFDLVLVSAPPFSSIPAAERIANHHGCPLVIDYRDLWTMNPHGTNPPARHVRAERRITARAAAITTVSGSLAEVMRGHFALNGRVHVVHNGFERDLLDGVQPTRFDHFAIVYAGSFYVPKRTVHPLLRALAQLDANGGIGREWQFHYYGTQDAHVLDAAREVGLDPKRVVCHGAVSRDEALAALAGAGLATVITTVTAEGTLADRGVVTGKIFEAIGLRRPLLVIAAPGSDVEDIVATSGLGHVVAGTDVDGIASAIADVAAGRVVPPREPDTYDWNQLAPKLNDVLRSALDA